jgi:PLP dependent protein
MRQHNRIERLRHNLDEVIWKIEQARISVSEHHIVQLISVAKYTEEADIGDLYELGQRAFGENQVQQLESRMQNLEALPIAWHFIGTLQKNKINKLIALRPTLMHSLDSIELALALNERLGREGRALSCLLQVNSAGETTKSGVRADRAIDLYDEILERCPAISLKGTMTIGAHTNNQALIQKSFEATHAIHEKLESRGASICSMGMSGDYELAIRCGSNMVRVGSALFG